LAEFDEAAVLAWLATSVPGLAAAQQVAAAAEMAEDEYNGPQLAVATAKSLRRLLKGTAAEAAVPVLLAARDAHLAAEVAEPEPAVAEPAVSPGCQICFETYGSDRPSNLNELPRCYKRQDWSRSLFLNRATLLRPGALTGGVAQRGGCAAPAAVRPRLLRGLPGPHAPVRPVLPTLSATNCQPQKLQTTRS
jgi:hypothetical protein